MREISLNIDELIARLFAFELEAKLFLLDSSGRTLGNSRYLIAGFRPVKSREIFCRTQADAFDALDFLDEQLKFYQAKHNSNQFFGGGFCGVTLSYEFGMLLENITPRPKEFKIFAEPSATFAFYENFAVYDYATRKTCLIGNENLNQAGRIFKSNQTAGNFSLKSNFTEAEYLAAVEKIRTHIRLGDIYQANLTQQLSVELPSNLQPEDVFLHLRQNHPAPFAAFVRRENDAVISASPERFFQVSNSQDSDSRIITASPIKGTRRRGRNAIEDAQLKIELEQSAKDRAENVMIVDLLRNDIGRVCEFGSVFVEKLCEIEEHQTLFHLVSTIRGRLRNDVKTSDLLKAAFPCGSITGAPKISAMQILDSIETAPRNLSMGAIGYFAFDGAADLSVAIRTMTIKNQTAIFNVGGGIVFDSQPTAEYEESWTKARALLAALGQNGTVFGIAGENRYY